jgi:hypothetical protein
VGTEPSSERDLVLQYGSLAVYRLQPISWFPRLTGGKKAHDLVHAAAAASTIGEPGPGQAHALTNLEFVGQGASFRDLLAIAMATARK